MNILVTAGPTREAIDPVRYLSNRSSGKMGYAVAAVAAARGHAVHLISGPVCLSPPAGVTVTQVVSAQAMLRAVEARFAWCQALVMCAAVADWRPRAPASEKIKKHDGVMSLELEPTPDILRRITPGKAHRIVVGFAAETVSPDAHAATKLKAKNLDYIIANDVSREDAGFEVDTNAAVVLGADGYRDDWPLMSKRAMADRIIDLVEAAVDRPRVITRCDRGMPN